MSKKKNTKLVTFKKSPSKNSSKKTNACEKKKDNSKLISTECNKKPAHSNADGMLECMIM